MPFLDSTPNPCAASLLMHKSWTAFDSVKWNYGIQRYLDKQRGKVEFPCNFINVL